MLLGHGTGLPVANSSLVGDRGLPGGGGLNGAFQPGGLGGGTFPLASN